MICVLVANKNKEEGNLWRNRLKKSGYAVMPECLDLSALVYALARDKTHFVVCSINLIEHNAFGILNAVMKFFPRVKIIIVGNMNHTIMSNILSRLTGVVIKNAFGTDLEKYLNIPFETSVDEESDVSRHISLLLGEHFLSREEAALLLARVFAKWTPGYVVLCVLTDSCHRQAFEAITDTLKEQNCGYALQFRFNEVCVIIDRSPDEEFCLNIADSIRTDLLKKTDASFSIGVSRMRYEAAELYACRREALRAAGASFLYGRDSVVHINYLSENDIEYIYPEHKEKRMIEQTLDGNKQEALRLLDEIFMVIRPLKTLHQSIINKIALNITVKLNIAASARAKSFEKTQMDSMSLGKLLSAKSTDEAYQFLKRGIHDFADEMDAFNDIRREILYIRLSELKEKKSDVSVSDLVRIFHSTVGFLNSAVARNGGGSIFDLFM